ncbi:MAG: hypothetical protein ICV76_00100 [Nitrospiraceae bacterium]|nr:hypothetical protein [Nitrospiraceae bacterium]
MLLSLTAAFMIGLISGSFLPYLPYTAGMLLALIGVALGWFERRHRVTTRQGLVLYGSVLAGVLYWTAYLWVAAGGPLPDLAGKTASKVVGTVVEPVRHAPGRAVLILVLSQVRTETSSKKIKGQFEWCGESRM